MRAVIPVAGVGTRLKPHTYAIPKVLINVAGKPILGYILDEIKRLGIEEIVLIIGHMGEKIKDYVYKNYGFKTEYVFQEERLGLGHALYLAKKNFGDKEILIILGDTIFKADLNGVLKGEHSSIGVKEVTDPRRFGTVELGVDGFVKCLVEKSQTPPSNLAIVGIYFIKNPEKLSECLEEIIDKNIKTAEEYQLTDALQLLIKRGEKMTAFNVEGWYDCGKPETLLSTNRVLLDERKQEYSLEGSVILPPNFIGERVYIENSVIGPYVSIADNSIIIDSIVKDSIINENAKVQNVLLSQSIIGSNAIIIGRFDRINLGDSSEIDLGG